VRGVVRCCGGWVVVAKVLRGRPAWVAWQPPLVLIRDARGFRAKGRRAECALRMGVGEADAPCGPEGGEPDESCEHWTGGRGSGQGPERQGCSQAQ
jgi:hypothetical protein